MKAIDPEEPFRAKLKALWLPKEMSEPPPLGHELPCSPVRAFSALLLNPFYKKDAHASLGKHVLTPTLALTSFAGATPAHWTLRYWDENLLHGSPPSDPPPAIVGITVHLTFSRRAFELAAWYRKRGSKVILGGLHVLSCPEECAPHADALAVGDGIQLWPLILRDFENGKLQPLYKAMYETEYREDPPPRRDLLPRKSFLTTSSLIATRGCHNRCGFCFLSTAGLRMPYRTRDTTQITGEFLADDQPYAVFIDNNLGSRPEYLRALCRALRPLEKIWSAAVTLDVTDDPTLIREMALAGCTGVFVGFESLSDANIASARKRSPRTKEYARRVGILRDHGIQVNGSFVLGFDEDRRDVFATTAGWIEENKLECATFHILTPYPGTPLFAQMESEGRLLHRDWSQYDTAHVVFQPKHMSPEELARGYGWILSTPLLAPIHLAAQAGRAERRPSLPSDVLPVQTLEPVLASAHKTRSRPHGVAPTRGLVPAPASPLSLPARDERATFKTGAATRERGAGFGGGVMVQGRGGTAGQAQKGKRSGSDE